MLSIIGSLVFAGIVVFGVVCFFRMLGAAWRGVPTAGHNARAQTREKARVARLEAAGIDPTLPRREIDHLEFQARHEALQARLAMQKAARAAAKADNPAITKVELREVQKAAYRESLKAHPDQPTQ